MSTDFFIIYSHSPINTPNLSSLMFVPSNLHKSLNYSLNINKIGPTFLTQLIQKNK